MKRKRRIYQNWDGREKEKELIEERRWERRENQDSSPTRSNTACTRLWRAETRQKRMGGGDGGSEGWTNSMMRD